MPDGKDHFIVKRGFHMLNIVCKIRYQVNDWILASHIAKYLPELIAHILHGISPIQTKNR